MVVNGTICVENGSQWYNIVENGSQWYYVCGVFRSSHLCNCEDKRVLMSSEEEDLCCVEKRDV